MPYSEGLAEAAMQKWPELSVKKIYDPAPLVGMRLPEFVVLPQQVQWESDYEAFLEREDTIKEEVMAWSRELAGVPFIFILVECFGGLCDNEGFVFRDGEKGEEIAGEKATTRLMRHLGVWLDEDEFFRPFTRGFGW